MKNNKVRHFRLTIANKLLLGFLSCGLLTILIGITTLSNLRQLDQINNRIRERDIPLVGMTDKLIEALLAQELYGRHSLILKSPEMEVLFWRRVEEVKKILQQIGNLPGVSNVPLDRLTTLHEEHTHLFRQGLEKGNDISSQTFQDHDRQLRQKQQELIQMVKGVAQDASEDQNQISLETSRVGNYAFWVASGLSMGSLLMVILIPLVITRNISRSINRLKLSTWEVSEGKFDRLPNVLNDDELEDLSQAFQRMAERLKTLEEMSLDANPLTHLPGSVAIESIVNKKLNEEIPYAFCQLDLSHFKAFNDRYGYARGNEVIQATANIVTEVVNGHVDTGAFVGHIGGDDFVVIASPERYEKICLSIIHSVDRMIRDFYDPEDRQRGYLQGKTRQGGKVSFPFMTLAIAVVTSQSRRLQNHIQVGEIAAELKNYAKSFPHSIFVVDRRGEQRTA